MMKFATIANDVVCVWILLLMVETIINELITIMGLDVLCSLLAKSLLLSMLK